MKSAPAATSRPNPAQDTPSRARFAPATPPDEGTRQHIATIVGQDGPITIAALAKRLELTTAAIRRHLDLMTTEGLVEAREDVPARRGRGRPAKAYVLTVAGHAQMRSQYDDLATEALAFLAEQVGPQAVTAFAEHRAQGMERRLLPILDRVGDEPAARVGALAAALRIEGYAATSRPVAEGTPAEAVQLCQGHCPVQQVAAEFPELCEAERAAFARLIGVDVRRLATLAQGDHVCTTHIPVGPRVKRRRPPQQRHQHHQTLRTETA